MELGLVGLGRMGANMARRLILGGHRAVVHDLDAAAVAAGGQYGAEGVASCGPRYLHSTGQLHQGGPASGLYLQLTVSGSDELPIPGQRYGFDVLSTDQSIGDDQALRNLGRRVIGVNLGCDATAGLRLLLDEF